MPNQPKKNVILLSMDEVRADHLSCYGYKKITTHNIDQVAEEGVLFETCIAAACITPVCMSSVICGAYPNKHTVRDPFSYIRSQTVTTILKEHGYQTAGFVGQGLLGSKHGFAAGFDYYDEPTQDTSWGSWNAEQKEVFYEGSWWIDRMLNWLKKNSSSPFFLWGHYFETHEGAEQALLRDGLIKPEELSEFSYKDAKIKYMDEKLIGPLLKTLDQLNLRDDTILILMSDHGTNLGEHPAKPVPHRSYNLVYPQHTTLYDVDIRVTLIIKGKELPKGARVKEMVRSVDVVPTILNLLKIPTDKMNFDGSTLLPVIAQEKVEGRSAYAEMLYPLVEGMGSLQAFRTDKFKFIRDLTNGTEEFYNLSDDPLEQTNLIKEVKRSKKQELRDVRKELNRHLFELKGKGADFSGQEKEEIKERLRKLGYME